MKRRNKILGTIFLTISIALYIFIIVSALMKGNDSGVQSSFVSTFIGNLINLIIPSKPIDVNDPNYLSFMRKFIGHFSLFGVAGIFTLLSFICLTTHKYQNKWWLFLYTLMIGFLFACLSELLQTYTQGRSGEANDVRIDFLGCMICTFVVFIIYLLIIKTKKKTPITEAPFQGS